MANRAKPRFNSDWRKKEANLAVVKYTKEEIIKIYRESAMPESLNSATELVSIHCLPPCSTGSGISGCVNSRRFNIIKEALPEWYQEEDDVYANNVEIEEEYSKIDVKYENSIKKVVEEEEKYPDWDDPGVNEEEPRSPELIIYPKILIENFVAEGNPFACIIIAHSIISDDSIITNPASIPFERVWYYKDPQNSVQGPFSTIEMFNWSAAGYFSSNLQIAHSMPVNFFSLQMYILQEKYKNLSNNIDKHL